MQLKYYLYREVLLQMRHFVEVNSQLKQYCITLRRCTESVKMTVIMKFTEI